jgi:hypothetical protein
MRSTAHWLSWQCGVEWAVHATAAQLDRLVGAQRRVVRTADVRDRHEARHLLWRWDDDGSLIGSFRLPPEQAAVLLQALEVAKAELPPAAVAAPDAPAEAKPDTPAEASHAPVDDSPAEAAPAAPARGPSTHSSRSPLTTSTATANRHPAASGSDINSSYTPPPTSFRVTTRRRRTA